MGRRLDGDQGLTRGAGVTPGRRPVGRRLADRLHGRRRMQLGLLLAGPLGWLGLAYLGSLAVLFVAAFWRLDPFTSQVVHEYGTQNFQTIIEGSTYRTIAGPDAGDRRAGDGRRRAARLPDRLLHGQGRAAADRRRCSSSRC